MNLTPLPNNAQGIIPYIDLNNIPFRSDSSSNDTYKELYLYPPRNIEISVLITSTFCQEYPKLEVLAILLTRSGRRKYDFLLVSPNTKTYEL